MEDYRHNRVVLTEACNNCGRVLKEEWKFCPCCKAKVNTYNCPFCNKEIKAQWEFCPYCRRSVKSSYLARKTFDAGNEWLKTILGK